MRLRILALVSALVFAWFSLSTQYHSVDFFLSSRRDGKSNPVAPVSDSRHAGHAARDRFLEPSLELNKILESRRRLGPSIGHKASSERDRSTTFPSSDVANGGSGFDHSPAPSFKSAHTASSQPSTSVHSSVETRPSDSVASRKGQGSDAIDDCSMNVITYRRPPMFRPPTDEASCRWLRDPSYARYGVPGRGPVESLCTTLLSLIHKVLWEQLGLLYTVVDGTMLSAYRNSGQAAGDDDLDIRVWMPEPDQAFLAKCGAQLPSHRDRLHPATALLIAEADRLGMKVSTMFFEPGADTNWHVWKLHDGETTCYADLMPSMVSESPWMPWLEPCSCPFGSMMTLCPSVAPEIVQDQYGPTWFFPLAGFKGYKIRGNFTAGLADPLDKRSEFGSTLRDSVRSQILAADENQDRQISPREIKNFFIHKLREDERQLHAQSSHQPESHRVDDSSLSSALQQQLRLTDAVWIERATALNDLLHAIDLQERSLVDP